VGWRAECPLNGTLLDGLGDVAQLGQLGQPGVAQVLARGFRGIGRAPGLSKLHARTVRIGGESRESLESCRHLLSPMVGIRCPTS